MLRARPAIRRDLIAQALAFAALVIVCVLLILQLGEEPRPGRAQPTVAPAAAPPLAPLVVLAPPGPQELATRPTEAGETRARAAQVERSPAPPPAPLLPQAGETPVRPHLVFRAARGNKKVAGALVSAKTSKARRLTPRRTTAASDVLLDEVVPSEGPLAIVLRDARWGKQTFRVEAREGEQRLQLSRARTGTLAGRIHSSDGTGAASLVLTLVDSEGVVTEPDDIDLRPDGRFRIEIVPGTYRVRAGGAGFCPSEWDRVSIGVDVETRVDLALIRAARVSGVIVAGSGPLARTTVDVELEAQTNDGPVTTTQKVRTGDDGTYELGEVRPGWYRLRAGDAARDGSWATVQVLEGQEVPNFTLSLDGGQTEPAVVGKVFDPSGQGVPFATILCHGRKATTDDLGSFILHVDPAEATPEVTIEAQGYVTVKKTLRIDPTRGRSAGFSVVLEPLD